MKNLNDLAQQIHENAKAKGFWDEPRNTGEVFMLIVSELSEALEADRKGKRASLAEINESESRGFTWENSHTSFEHMFKQDIKDTLEDELADVVIRILDWIHVEGLKADIDLYESQGDFDIGSDVNIGWVLFEMTKWVCKAHMDRVLTQEACLNAVLILAKNLSIYLHFDLMRHIQLKMHYNSTREHKHGKAY
jgi:NTP pyrophosphatase (non-canonical NTP hydrolase)